MPANSGSSRRRSTWFQPMCGRRGASLEHLGPAGQDAEVSAPSSSLPSNSSCSPRQIPRYGRSARSQPRIGSSRPYRREARHGRAGGADPGHDEPVDAASVGRRAGEDDVGADRLQALADADEVAGAVVDDRDPRPARRAARAHLERALERRDARSPRIDLARDAQRAAQRLERGLGEVMVVAARAAQVERCAGRSRERFQRVLDQLRRQLRRCARRGTAGR